MKTPGAISLILFSAKFLEKKKAKSNHKMYYIPANIQKRERQTDGQTDCQKFRQTVRLTTWLTNGMISDNQSGRGSFRILEGEWKCNNKGVHTYRKINVLRLENNPACRWWMSFVDKSLKGNQLIHHDHQDSHNHNPNYNQNQNHNPNHNHKLIKS